MVCVFDTYIRAASRPVFEKNAPLPVDAHQRNPMAGAETTPSMGTPLCTNAISVAHTGTPRTKLVQLQTDALRARGFGDFWQHMLVAQGAIDVAVDVIGLAPYDNAAIYPIVQEAGGTITNRFGVADWRADSSISSNEILHSDIITRLQ